MRPKPLHEQVIVITGASSGIGLTTAMLAAKRGARVVLVARNEAALRQTVTNIQHNGGVADWIVADVGIEQEVQRIGEFTRQRFGRIDTWINNAMVSIFGKLTEVPVQEQRRLFDTNYWGVVHGSRTAVEHLRESGGVLINIGSVLSDRAVPLQGAYCASKFAVKGFTEALRMEIEMERLPIWVTLVKPSSIDTPYYRVARNFLPRAPKNPPPVYDPLVAAETILYCCEHRVRDVVIGAGGLLSVAGGLLPRLTDHLMERLLGPLQTMDQPAGPREQHNLFHPVGGGQQRGGHPNHVARSSLYTQASLHPLASGAILLAAAALSFNWWKHRG